MPGDDDFDYEDSEEYEKIIDPVEIEAKDAIRKFFEENQTEVFFSRQIELLYENTYFHWITNRAIRDLVEEGTVKSEFQKLKTGGKIKLLWYKSYRFYKRNAGNLAKLVEEYSDPNITAALGLQGELMVLEGFARLEFVMKGRNTRSFGEKNWTDTDHDLDFIFAKDSVAYGIEVKNSLSYIENKEFKTKIELCHHIGVQPVFVVRMMPRPWIQELYEAGGFALILKYQFYPLTHRDLAKRVKKDLKLPVDSPKALQDGTMQRFLRWHMSVISRSNSQGTI